MEQDTRCSCIKVLQTLGCYAMQDAIDIQVLRTLGVARDRPTPYGSRRDFSCPTVVRGPVPRDGSIQTKNACSTEAMDVF